MKATLVAGLTHELNFVVSEAKLVPALYPESPDFLAMPPVFATGFLVGVLEWACLLLSKPHLDWPAEQTVGTRIDVTHEAATPAGFVVTARAHLAEVAGRRLVFRVEAHDGVDIIARGTHERTVIVRERFDAKLATKLGARPRT
ncbi:MAG: thioesterase family protein [Burkholderiales bacterium]|nr:thioesterase family protein [Burkholderiales bacterium]